MPGVTKCMTRDKGTGGGFAAEDSKNGQDGGPTACGQIRCSPLTQVSVFLGEDPSVPIFALFLLILPYKIDG